MEKSTQSVGIRDIVPATSSQNARATRSNTPATNLSGNTQEVNNVTEARKCLEELDLLVPYGAEATSHSLATALFYIAEMKTVPLQAKNGIRSVAFLLGGLQRELEAGAIVEKLTEQLAEGQNELSKDIRFSLDNTVAALDNKMAELQHWTEEIIKKNAQTVPNHAPSYRDALVRPTGQIRNPAIDPRLLAREAIKKRQILLDIDSGNDELRAMDIPATTKYLNNAIAKIDESNSKDRLIQSIRKLRNGGLLVEMKNEEATLWLQQNDVSAAFNVEIKQSATFKKRAHNTIAFFVPLTFDPDNPTNIEELIETNDLNPNDILKAKWAKAPERRLPSQTSGHLLISFSNPDIANKAILNGLVICNKCSTVQKCKKEPLRCMKCQGWNHVASACDKSEDVCGTCGDNNHKTSDCNNPGKKKCISCDTDDHTSWDRNCPTFLRKCEEQNQRNQENVMPFFPSTEDWSWALNPPPQSTIVMQAPSFLDQATRPPRRNQLRQTQLPFQPTPYNSNANHQGSQNDSRATGPNAASLGQHGETRRSPTPFRSQNGRRHHDVWYADR
jgi:hypothetical protein